MNPVEIGQGKSFKGLAAYLLHDIGQAASADRVSWTQSFNLDDADPERAWKLMAATAMSADELKAAAGIKKGRKAVNTAYHFSLNFNPADNPTEAMQRAAVDGALKALGLDSYQSLAVAHRDKEHQHVHVMVNLINPENGISAASKQPDGSASKLSNTQRKLSQWAKGFERENGLAITEGRLENANKRAQGETVDARRKPRNVLERAKTETTDRRRDLLKASFGDQERDLSAEARAMHERQRNELAAAKESYRLQKDALWRAHKARAEQQTNELKEQARKRWAAMFARQRDEKSDFDRGEKSVIGRIWHGAATFKDRALDGDALGGFLAAFSQAERRAILQRKHDREAKTLDKQVHAAFTGHYEERAEELKAMQLKIRQGFLIQSDELKSAHMEDRASMKERWRSHNAERREALAADAGRQTRAPAPSRDWSRGRGRGLEPS